MIGQNIKRMRKLKGWSQETLARKMGYKDKSAINKIENNVNDVNQKKINQFAEVFKCDPTELMVESYDSPEEFELAWHRSGGGRHPLDLSDLEHEIVLSYRCADTVTQNNICKLLDIEPQKNVSKSSKGA